MSVIIFLPSKWKERHQPFMTTGSFPPFHPIAFSLSSRLRWTSSPWRCCCRNSSFKLHVSAYLFYIQTRGETTPIFLRMRGRKRGKMERHLSFDNHTMFIINREREREMEVEENRYKITFVAQPRFLRLKGESSLSTSLYSSSGFIFENENVLLQEQRISSLMNSSSRLFTL